MRRPYPLCAPLAAFLLPAFAGCVSDSLKFARKPTSPASAAPTPIVEQVDYSERPAATYSVDGAPVQPSPTSAAPLGGFYATPSSAPGCPAPVADPASVPPSLPAFNPSPSSSTSPAAPGSVPLGDFGAADQREERRLREELLEARADARRQIDANESLLRQTATYRRDAEETVAALRRQNAELAEKNRVLLADAAELRAEREFLERRRRLQDAATRRPSTTVVVPNNSVAALDLRLSDPKILPIRRDGDVATIELQDDLLFKPNSNEFSEEGKDRLRLLATDVLRRYPTNVLAIQGHSDLDPARPEDALSAQAASVQKAYLVAEFLVEETGVARNQTIVGGSGAVSPIVSNENETNRRRNRRVEIAIRPETIVPRFELARSALAPTSAPSSAVDSSRTAASTVKSNENPQTVSAAKTDKTGLAPAPGAAKRIVR
ncbi:MAG: OmpA family protein [Thermoguttaceae bacterium]|nr:OmpA family protein [Thermoguttaceae bacterium]